VGKLVCVWESAWEWFCALLMLLPYLVGVTLWVDVVVHGLCVSAGVCLEWPQVGLKRSREAWESAWGWICALLILAPCPVGVTSWVDVAAHYPARVRAPCTATVTVTVTPAPAGS